MPDPKLPKQELGHAEPPMGPADEIKGHKLFPIVGIGASAGGLEAFTQLLGSLPSDTGMAFLLVQHLDPRHESRLTDLLAKTTPMPVVEATHNVPVRQNHVYIIPPNSNMAITDSHLHITPRPEGRGPHLPVDYLFRSLAENQGAQAIAVVLSGTGSDGTLGLCEIKAVGGITFAQDEKSAKHNGMPRSAVESGCVDFVLQPQEISNRLVQIGKHPYLTPAAEPKEHEPSTEPSYKRILNAIRNTTGVDFSLYRESTIKRRIMRRMALHGQSSWTEYAKRLVLEPNETEALYHDLLINVTSFFRDPEMFDTLKTKVFPEILKDKAPGDPVRVWVPGCSTGQEAYSFAIAFLEYTDDKPVRPRLQIFATDLSDQTALDKGRAGIFPESIEGEVSSERLRRFFRKEDHVYRIDKSIRDMCVFARQNVVADPPFSHLDAISCRNVLIYLSTPLQKKVIPTFHYALNSPGFLILGSAETVGDFNDLFEAADRTHKVYLKKHAPVRQASHFPIPELRAIAGSFARRPGPAGAAPPDFQKEADRILLGRFAPPGVLVNENFDVVQFRGRTSRYLESPPGEPTTGLFKMAREGLFLELRNALNEAKKRNQPVQRDGIRVRTNGSTIEIGIEVVPVRPQGVNDGCFLILFHEPSFPAAQEPPATVPLPITESQSAKEILQLRQELAATREYLQSLVEQQDAANEELRSANEEILSSNEELHSTNEELETAKEELQSGNEELTTINEQLSHRNIELAQANNDIINLLTSTNMPLVMVGGDGRIRRFTTPAKKVMNLLPTDIGRPLSDIRPPLPGADLETIIAEVIEKIQPIEQEVCDRDGRWYVLRVQPYRTHENKLDGAVLVLFDIQRRKLAEEELRDKANRLRSIVDHVVDGIVTIDEKGRIESFNPEAEKLFQHKADAIAGQDFKNLLAEQFHADFESRLEGYLRTSQEHSDGRTREMVGKRSDGSTFPIELALNAFEHQSKRYLTGIIHDVTERKRLEESLQQRIQALAGADRQKDEFLAMLAHELRNPLGPVRNAVEIMRLGSKDPATVNRAREMLDRQVKQMTRIVDDLIDVSRIIEKKIQLRKERVVLSDIFETALETCRSMIEGRGHRLQVNLPKEPMILEADPARMTQILVNLLNNASKFTDPGGQIWLSAERVAEKESNANAFGTLEIRVRDSGVGMAANLLPQIFEMFTQGERTIDRRQGGLGIGLSLVRSLVQMQGGVVEARSAGPGRGSEFIVRMPLADVRKPEPPAKVEPAPAAKTAKSKRILVVDDSRDQAQSLGLLLKLLGHDVRTDYDGATALETAKQFKPDIVLLDIGLPKMNGYEVARRIREIPALKNVLLVAQTGWGQEEHRRRSIEAGFDHHFVKPVSIESLEEILQQQHTTTEKKS